MEAARIWALISLIVLIAIIVVLAMFKFRKNEYLLPYQHDEVYKEEQALNSTNYVCAPHGETLKYIQRYLFKKGAYDSSVILSFADTYEEISYFVLGYDKNHKVIDCCEGIEYHPGVTSRMINMSKKAVEVNVIVKSVNHKHINQRVIKPMPKVNMRLYSLLASIMLFNIMFLARHFAVEICLKDNGAYIFEETSHDGILIPIMAVLSICYYFISMHNFKKKAIDFRDGGVSEYEFLQ